MSSLLYLLLTLAILVVVHEYGHFWVARRCGVKVLKFSVGFGKPIWNRVAQDGTEYIIAAIPLGGYVKMLDEREGDVAKEELEHAFNRKPLSARVAIVAAGPIANLLFAVVAYSFIFMVGIPGVRPIVDEVTITSPASIAGVTVGDEITAVNGRDTPTWRSVNRELLDIAIEGGAARVTVKMDGNEAVKHLSIPKQEITTLSATALMKSLGLKPYMVELKPVIANVVDNGPAQLGGLQAGDSIVSVNGDLTKSWNKLVSIVQSNANEALTFVVMRESDQIELVITPYVAPGNVGKIGASVDSQKTVLPKELQAVERYGLIDALIKGTHQTWSFSALTLKSIGGMLIGDVSSDNIGGPITIAQYASSSANGGFISFVSFLAMISISLGLLNLLPIPVLDGGHLAMYFIEWIRGEALSEQSQLQLQKLGIILLLMLMFLAFFNDLTRLFG